MLIADGEEEAFSFPTVDIGLYRSRRRQLRTLSRTSHFVVNVLSAGQEEISRLFAGEKKDGELFARLKTLPAIAGIPAIVGALATIECKTLSKYEGGDHTILFGQVERLHYADGEPLINFCGKYNHIAI